VKKVSDNGKMVHSAQADIGPRPRSCGPGSMAYGGPGTVRRQSQLGQLEPPAGHTCTHRLPVVARSSPMAQPTRREEASGTSTRGPQ
jgi:hypothetical protein